MGKSSRLHKKVVEGTLTAKDAIDQALAHGIAAGRQSMKAEIVAVVEERKAKARYWIDTLRGAQDISAQRMIDTHESEESACFAIIDDIKEIEPPLTRIERTET